jgi:hypothetical protein
MSPSVPLLPSRDLVEAKARRILPRRDVRDLLQILDAAVTNAPAVDRERIQLAVLKLYEEGAGKHELETVAGWAKDDWRDVLSWAQYPRQSRRAGTPAAAKETAADAAEWQAWLDR